MPRLFYADDGLMLSIDAGGMHPLCAILNLFCMRSHMQVNLKPGKTEMMIFAVSDSVRAALNLENILGIPLIWHVASLLRTCVVFFLL